MFPWGFIRIALFVVSFVLNTTANDSINERIGNFNVLDYFLKHYALKWWWFFCLNLETFQSHCPSSECRKNSYRYDFLCYVVTDIFDGGTHAPRCTRGGQRAALQSPLLLPFHLHLGFRSNTGHQAQTTCVFTPELSRWPSPTFLPETGCLPEPAVVGLGNAGEPVLGCAWQCWSYSATGRTCFSMVAGDPDSGSHAWAVSASSMLPAPLTFCSDMDFLFY